MNTKELQLILKTAEDLDIHNLTLVINEGRDGETAYVEVTARIDKDAAGKFILVFDYE